MNFNRRRNIFTLGDYHTQQHPQQQIKAQLNRRQNSDPFERDPFKIQSYNFRYADRPAYPLPNLANRVGSHSSVKRFETFYYNYDFAPARHDKENPSANKFHEFRRRKFLYDQHQQQQQNPPTNLLNQTITSRQSGFVRHQHRQQQLRAATASAICDSSCTSIANGGCGSTCVGAARTTATSTASRTTSALSAFKQSGSPLLRSVCNRDYMQGMRTTTPSSTQATRATAGTGGGGGGGGPAAAAAYAYRPQQLQQHHHQQQQQQSQQQQPQSQQQQHSSQYGSQCCSQHDTQQFVVSRIRSCSRSSLAGAVESENRGKYNNYESAVAGAPSGNSSGSSIRAFAFKNIVREMPGPRTSASEHSRRPLQTLQAATQNLITANVEQACGSCSGCQININIKGLDNKQLGENVTIKIEADTTTSKNTNNASNGNNGSRISSNIATRANTNNNGNSNDNHCTNNSNYIRSSNTNKTNNNHQNNDSSHRPQSPSNNLSSKITSPNKTDTLNIIADNSSGTFVIDKRLSKFSVQDKYAEKRSNNERDNKDGERLRTAAATAANERGRARERAREAIRSTRQPQQPLKCLHSPYDDVARKLPKNAKERLPSMVPWHIDGNLRKSFNSKENSREATGFRSANQMRSIRTNYNSAGKDLRNLKQYTEQQQQSKTPELPRAGGCREDDRKILNTLPYHRKLENIPKKQSSHSLCTTNDSKNITLGSLSSDHSSSFTEKNQGSTQPLFVQSRQNLTKSPFNVNINVYADKLKLLRV